MADMMSIIFLAQATCLASQGNTAAGPWPPISSQPVGLLSAQQLDGSGMWPHCEDSRTVLGRSNGGPGEGRQSKDRLSLPPQAGCLCSQEHVMQHRE